MPQFWKKIKIISLDCMWMIEVDFLTGPLLFKKKPFIVIFCSCLEEKINFYVKQFIFSIRNCNFF